jgi:hypothetical protein
MRRGIADGIPWFAAAQDPDNRGFGGCTHHLIQFAALHDRASQ